MSGTSMPSLGLLPSQPISLPQSWKNVAESSRLLIEIWSFLQPATILKLSRGPPKIVSLDKRYSYHSGIPRDLGVPCQELRTKTKQIFLIISHPLTSLGKYKTRHALGIEETAFLWWGKWIWLYACYKQDSIFLMDKVHSVN